MAILIIAIIIIIVLVVHSKNKEKEEDRQRYQRMADAENIRKKYEAGYDEWKRRKNPYPYSSVMYMTLGSNSYEDIIAHKDEIIRLDREIADKNRDAARKDEAFEKEQKFFSDQCYSLSKQHLDGFGRYHYNIEWHKRKPSGGWSNEEFSVWQFFADGACFDQDLDYTHRDCEKKNAINIPEFKNKTRHWNQSVYDKLNGFISTIAKLSSRPLIVAMVDYLIDWDLDAIDYHFSKINRNVDNAVFVPLSRLHTVIDSDNRMTEHLIVIDVFSENSQLKKTCNEIESSFCNSRVTIAYFSFLKCYDRDEMAAVLEQEKIMAQKKELKIEADCIKSFNPNGFERWKASLVQSGYNEADISDQMIIDSIDPITELQIQFEKEGPQIIEQIISTVSSWDHLVSGFPYKYLLRYYPVTCEFDVNDEEWDDRYKVWNFKNNEGKVSEESHKEALSWVIENVKKVLDEDFGAEALKHLTFACIPASSKKDTERRFKDFSDRFCALTGMDNAYPHIIVAQDSTPKNKGGIGKPVLEFDVAYFKNKNIILFDDIITKGFSMERMKAELEEFGATVIAGFSIGRTFHHRP